jgi:hypothetical protein
MLNHIDWCLVNKQNYWQTIQDKFIDEADRVPDKSQIGNRLKYICRKQMPTVRRNHLMDRGTVVLENAMIADTILQAMKRGRENLGLKVVDQRKKKVQSAHAGLSQVGKQEDPV